jgi:hypothetical protein
MITRSKKIRRPARVPPLTLSQRVERLEKSLLFKPVAPSVAPAGKPRFIRIDANGRAPQFRALDPELPSLAAKAAFQLDNLRLEAQGKIQGELKQDAIAKFALRLQGVVRPGPDVDKRSLLDPLTSSVLHGAVLQATQDKPNNLDDMLVQIGHLTEQLLKIEGFRGHVDMVTALRDFCLAISDLATSKQYLVRAPRPYHGPMQGGARCRLRRKARSN